MNKLIFSILIAIALLLLLTTTAASRDSRDVNGRYDVMAERTFDGTAACTVHLFEGFMYFALQAADKTIEVQLGPKSFVESRGFNVKAGDSVSVVGAMAKLSGREVLLAREVRTMTMLFVVRDRNGEPMWNPNRPVQMDTEFNELPMCQMMDPRLLHMERVY